MNPLRLDDADAAGGTTTVLPPPRTLSTGLPAWLADDAIVTRLAAERARIGGTAEAWEAVAWLAEALGVVALVAWPDPLLAGNALRRARTAVALLPEPGRAARCQAATVLQLPPYAALGPGSAIESRLVGLAAGLAAALLAAGDPAATAAVVREARDVLVVYREVATLCASWLGGSEEPA